MEDRLLYNMLADLSVLKNLKIITVEKVSSSTAGRFEEARVFLDMYLGYFASEEKYK